MMSTPISLKHAAGSGQGKRQDSFLSLGHIWNSEHELVSREGRSHFSVNFVLECVVLRGCCVDASLFSPKVVIKWLKILHRMNLCVLNCMLWLLQTGYTVRFKCSWRGRTQDNVLHSSPKEFTWF